MFEGFIAILGPMGVGKTPVAEMVAERLGIDHVMLDLEEDTRIRCGWHPEESWKRALEGGYVARFEYDARFSVQLVDLLMNEHSSAVIDCGGDDLVGWSNLQRSEIKSGLQSLGLTRIAAILPFPDAAKSQAFLAGHDAARLNDLLIANPSYREIAEKVFYTHGRELEPIAEAVLEWAATPACVKTA